MKKIVTLLAVFLMDFILLEAFVAAEDNLKLFTPDVYSFLLLFLTLAMTMFLFYEHHFQKAHENWRNFYQDKAESVFTKIENRKISKTKLEVKKDKKFTVEHKENKEEHKIKVPKRLGIFNTKKAPSLELQYEFVELVKNNITEMRSNGSTDGEIIKTLKEQQWDPQVIFIALSRVKKQEISRS
ncbi:MAG: hypothetical protein KKG59_02940 [Nanoarchaeota archaeon]|nr:hypothetical protein [Nanoarchaeota archaeon]